MPIQTRRSASKQGSSSSPGVQTRSRAASAATAPRSEAPARRKRKQSPASIPRRSRKKSVDQSPQQAAGKAETEVKQEPKHPNSTSGADEAGPSKPATPKRASQKKASKDEARMADGVPAEQGDDAGQAANQVRAGSHVAAGRRACSIMSFCRALAAYCGAGSCVSCCSFQPSDDAPSIAVTCAGYRAGADGPDGCSQQVGGLSATSVHAVKCQPCMQQMRRATIQQHQTCS